MSTCATPTLTLHRVDDPRLGACLAVANIPNYLHPEFKRLGLSYREVSGRRDRGGPGHRVGGVWILPLRRWEMSALLRAEIRLLIASNNGSPMQTVADLRQRVEELKHGKR